MVMHLVIVLLLMGSLEIAVFAQCQGGREVEPNVVTITHPSIFNMIGSSPICTKVNNRPLEMECSGRDIVIVDRNTGPTTPNLSRPTDVQMFLTWQRQNRTDFLVAFITFTPMTFSSVELYFLSYPTQRIGLPDIQLFGSTNRGVPNDLSGGTPINYTFSDVFTPQENTVNHVTLPFLSNPGALHAVRLQMSFTGVDNIDWFFLSEIRVCTGTTPPSLPAIQFQSPSDGERVVPDTSSGTPTSVVLNCTVSVAGVFEWRWRKDNQTLQNGGRFQITTALGTRSSKLAISQLRSTDAGSYTCEVRHQSQSGYQSRTMELVLPGTPGVTPIPTPVTRETPVTGGSIETTASVPVSGGGNGGGGNGGIIAAAVVIPLLAIGSIVIFGIVLVLLLLRHRKTTASKTKDLKPQNNYSVNGKSPTTKTAASDSPPHTENGTELQPAIYSTVNKEPPPVIPKQSFDMLELYDNTLYEDPMKEPSRQLAGPSQYNGPLKISKMSDQSRFALSQNPTYQSKEEAEQINANYESIPIELNIYADPMCSRSLTVDNTLESDEPIYSEPLDPTLLFGQNSDESGGSDFHPYGGIYAEPQPLKKSEAPFEIKASNVREVKQLGIGLFGEVMLAETIGVSLKDLKLSQDDDNKNVHIQVAVKKLKPQVDALVRKTFEKEIKFMSRLKNDNIVCLLAICTSDVPFIVMEYMENGDLNQYLQKYQLAISDFSPNKLPTSILVYMAVQIASGMRYLASFKYVHRDLATRNCLVGKNFVVKIADFGMSRSLYEGSYYRVRGRLMLPIRWMSTESFYGKFWEKTDVWAFGVTMWEIFTFCQHQPYEELDDQEVIQDAVRGTSRQLLPKPEGCPQDIYELMLRCWEYAADERANFEEIFSTLAALHKNM